MKRIENPAYMLSIDIGSSKIGAVAARRNERKTIEILGVGIHPCAGISATGIVDLDEIVVSISNACTKALNQIPGNFFRKALVGVSGGFIQSQNSVASQVLSRHGRAVTHEDIEQSIHAAISKSVPKDFEVIHAIPRWFRLDETPYIRDPLGMEGSVLEVDVHLIIGRKSILKNLKKAVTLAGYVVEDIAYQPIASSESVLTEEEKNTGVALVDIGGEITSMLVYYEGSIYHSQTIEIGGADITRDINHYFQTPMENAETLKRYSGTATVELIDPNEMVEIIRFKNRRTLIVEKRRLCEVIEARVEQIVEEVIRALRAKDLMNLLFAGVVLTGGTSLMDGIVEKTRKMTQKEIQIGYPNGVVGFETIVSSPLYAASIGLLHFGYMRRDAQLALYGMGMKRFVRKGIRWIQEHF